MRVVCLHCLLLGPVVRCGHSYPASGVEKHLGCPPTYLARQGQRRTEGGGEGGQASEQSGSSAPLFLSLWLEVCQELHRTQGEKCPASPSGQCPSATPTTMTPYTCWQ